MKNKDLLHRCFRCGFCKLPKNLYDLNCPSYLKYRYESFSPGGRLWLISAWLNGELEMSERLLKIIFSCAMCKNCGEACGIPAVRENITQLIVDARAEVIARGVLPRTVRDCLTDIMRNQNAFKMLQSDRDSWTKGIEIERFSGQEYLFYVGDAGAFDTTKMTREVASLLMAEGVSIGILGKDEKDDGNDVGALGETDLFEEMAHENIRLFKELGVQNIIALSPHAYHSMKNDYPKLGGKFNVFHYSQIVAEKLRQSKPRLQYSAQVVYQDPCYLGRWNGEYSSAREILESVNGITLLEMNKNKANALCCGGGGGNYYTDMLGSGENSSSRILVRNAHALGAENVITACPICFRMLDDAIKDEGLESVIAVKDVAQIVNESR